MKQIKFTDRRILLILMVVIGIILLLYADMPSVENNNSADSAFVLEQKIADMVEQTYAVDRVSVIITYDTMGEKITASGSHEKGNIFDNSNNEPFVVSEKLPYVRGVLISAEHLTKDNAKELQVAVATLLGINSSKVNVIYSN